MGVFPLTSMFFGLRDQDKYEQLKGREVKTYPWIQFLNGLLYSWKHVKEKKEKTDRNVRNTVKHKFTLTWQCCREVWVQLQHKGTTLPLKGTQGIEGTQLPREGMCIWGRMWIPSYLTSCSSQLLNMLTTASPQIDKALSFIFSDRDQNLKRWMEGFHWVWQLPPQHSSHTCSQHDSYLLSAAPHKIWWQEREAIPTQPSDTQDARISRHLKVKRKF